MTVKKVAIITGASSGIGKALSLEAAKNGYYLALAGRDEQRLVAVRNEIKVNFNVDVLIFSGDISLETNCKTLINQTFIHFGRIDLLINNAGISMRAIFQDTDLSVIQRLMDVNFWGSVYCTKYALPYLLDSRGSIIGISSIAGIKGLPARTGYSASKFALQGFLESLRIENRKNGLHVLIACPGYTESNIRNTALNKNGEPQGESPLNENKLMRSEKVAFQIWKAYKRKKAYLIMSNQGKLLNWISKISIGISDYLVYNFVRREINSPIK